MKSPKRVRPPKRGVLPAVKGGGKDKRAKPSSSINQGQVHNSINGDVNPQILNLALSWLDPKDLARCSQVCKDWHRGINQHSWKQAAENAKPEALQALVKATGKKTLDSKAMAVGLSRHRHCPASPQFPKPTLRGEEIFLLLELTVMNTTRAWCKSLKEAVEDFPSESGKIAVDFTDVLHEPSTLEFQIPPAELDEYCAAYFGHDKLIVQQYGFENMSLSLSLWRVDTGQSFCFLSSDRENDLYDCHNDKGILAHQFDCWVEKPTANTPAGKVARDLLFWRSNVSLSPSVQVSLLPTESGEGIKFDPAGPNYKCRLHKINVDFLFFSFHWDQIIGEPQHIGSADYFLLFLEGLNWR